MRKRHILRRVSNISRPQNIIFFDTETAIKETSIGIFHHELKLGYASFHVTTKKETLKQRDELVFRKPNDFWKWVISKSYDKKLLYIVSHNLNYDLPVVKAFTYLPNAGYKLTSFYQKGLTGIYRFKNGNSKIVILDNGNFFQGSIEYFGKLLGFPKLTIDFDNADDDTLLDYCIRDTQIIYRLWLNWLSFLDENDIGDFRVTLGSTAFNTFRYRFINRKILIHDNQKAIDLERKSYHGGRVECLYHGEKYDSTFYYMDFNSMYPYLMKQRKYPAKLLGFSDKVDISILLDKIKKYAIIADVMIYTEDNAFMVKHNNRNMFPIGYIRTVLTTPELEYALENGSIIEVYSMAWYTKASIFSDYVDFFYGLRLKYRDEVNPAFEKICKLFLNSLYGKFGQTGLEQTIFGYCGIDDIGSETVLEYDTHETYTLTKLAGTIFKTVKSGESYNSFPAIASHVTAYGRIFLYSHIKMVPDEHIYYMDTDSLIVDDIGYEYLQQSIDNDKLGSLKIETSGSYINIRSPKDYTIGERTKAKGISKNAIQIDRDTYRQWQWYRIQGLIQLGDIDGYYTREITKHLKRDIKSGNVLDSGYIKPFYIDMREL